MPIKNKDTLRKEDKLNNVLKSLGSAAVAFSGGTDSSYLLYTAHKLLGKNVLAITAESPIYTEHELEEAIQFCRKYDIPHILVDIKILNDHRFYLNSIERCYFCKWNLFQEFWRIAKERGFEHVLDGSNVSDLVDRRPGRRALKELGVRSPLTEAGLAKEEVRELSRQAGLLSWDKPSFACLASRINYGNPITIEKLKKIEEAEKLVRKMGFKEFRVRLHDNLARLEISKREMKNVLTPEMAIKISKELKKIGFTYVTLDLEGFRSGSMNEILFNKQRI
jgi:uncharacterized protein